MSVLPAAVFDEANKTVTSSITPAEIQYTSLVECLVKKISQWGDKEVLVDIDSGRSWTAIALRDTVLRLANVLIGELGLKKGQIVAFYCPNSDYHVILQLAVIAAGGIYTGCPNGLKYREITTSVLVSEADYLVCSHETLETAEQLRSNFDVWKVIVIDADEYITFPHTNILSFQTLLRLQETPDFKVPLPCDIEKDMAALLPSSGTKGTPKMVVRTHLNLLNFCVQMLHPSNVLFLENDVTICYQPIALPIGQIVIWSALMTGAKVYIATAFDAEKYVEVAADKKVTAAVFFPPHIDAVIDYSLSKGKNLSTLKHVVTMGSHLPENTADRMLHQLKIETLSGVYGMIELGIATVIPRGMRIVGLAGLPAPGVTIKIKKRDSGTVVGPSQIGEILVKSKQVTPGYHKLDSASYFDEEGFFKTGDSGYYDKEGFLKITDTYKELIKCDGQQVSPEELESILSSHGSVQEAAVVGVADEKHGQVPKAFVIVRRGSILTPDDLDEFVRDQVAPWKQLKGGIVFMEQLPNTPTGGVDRRRLSIY